MPTIETILSRAKALNIPITEYEFTPTKQNPAPDPPFIVYMIPEKQSGSDEKNRIRDISASIELYTDRKPDPKLESRIENEVLFDQEFSKNVAPIPNENMYQTAYDFEIIQKK